MTCQPLLRASCFAAIAFLPIACLPVACAAPGNSEQATASTATTELFPVKDLVFATKDQAATLPIGDLVQALAQATGLSRLPSDSYAIDAEASGIIRVTASADMQNKVQIVLKDMRRMISDKQKI